MLLTQPRTTSPRKYADDPHTAEDFTRLAALPRGVERDELKQQLAVAWLPMAHRLALRFRNRGEDVEDLKQVAAMALVKAVDRFDPDRAEAFASFAVPTVIGEVKRHFRDHMWSVHVPRRVQDLRNQVRYAARDLDPTPGGRAPTVPQLAAHTGLSEDDVLTGMGALSSFNTLSLDAPLTGGDGDFSLTDTLGDTDTGYDHVLYREAVKPQLEVLPERERRILYLRFFCDMTQAGIAKDQGISQMHVSRLLRKACTQIRESVDTVEAAPA